MNGPNSPDLEPCAAARFERAMNRTGLPEAVGVNRPSKLWWLTGFVTEHFKPISDGALICQNSARRRSWAFTATTTVLSDISIAPSAAGGTMPQGASAPAARGIAKMLYPAAHHRF